jgi:hypothetical protein
MTARKPGTQLVRFRVAGDSSSGAGLLRRELFPRESTPADAIAIHARCL